MNRFAGLSLMDEETEKKPRNRFAGISIVEDVRSGSLAPFTIDTLQLAPQMTTPRIVYADAERLPTPPAPGPRQPSFTWPEEDVQRSALDRYLPSHRYDYQGLGPARAVAESTAVEIPPRMPAAAPIQQEAPRPRTVLTPWEEQEFQAEYRALAKRMGLDADPDNPLHKYDYRGWWKAKKADPERYGITGTTEEHFPSEFKDEDHPNRYVNGIDTKTGKPIEGRAIPVPSFFTAAHPIGREIQRGGFQAVGAAAGAVEMGANVLRASPVYGPSAQRAFEGLGEVAGGVRKGAQWWSGNIPQSQYGSRLWGSGEDTVYVSDIINSAASSAVPMAAMAATAAGATGPMAAYLAESRAAVYAGKVLERFLPKLKLTAVEKAGQAAVGAILAGALTNAIYEGSSQYAQARNDGEPEEEARKQAVALFGWNMGTALTNLVGAIPGLGRGTRALVGSLQESLEETFQEVGNRVVSGKEVKLDKEMQLNAIAGLLLGGGTEIVTGDATDRAAGLLKKHAGDMEAAIKEAIETREKGPSPAPAVTAEQLEAFRQEARRHVGADQGKPITEEQIEKLIQGIGGDPEKFQSMIDRLAKIPLLPTAAEEAGGKEEAAVEAGIVEPEQPSPVGEAEIDVLRREARQRGLGEAAIEELVRSASVNPAVYQKQLQRVLQRPLAQVEEQAAEEKTTEEATAPAAEEAASISLRRALAGLGGIRWVAEAERYQRLEAEEKRYLASTGVVRKKGTPAAQVVAILQEQAPELGITTEQDLFDRLSSKAGRVFLATAVQPLPKPTEPPVLTEKPKEEPEADVGAPMPDWMKANYTALAAPLERSGVADQIEELAAQRMTARQIAAQLKLGEDEVRAVRAVRSIPSMGGISSLTGANQPPSEEEKATFESWLNRRQERLWEKTVEQAPTVEPAAAPRGPNLIAVTRQTQQERRQQAVDVLRGINQLLDAAENEAEVAAAEQLLEENQGVLAGAAVEAVRGRIATVRATIGEPAVTVEETTLTAELPVAAEAEPINVEGEPIFQQRNVWDYTVEDAQKEESLAKNRAADDLLEALGTLEKVKEFKRLERRANNPNLAQEEGKKAGDELEQFYHRIKAEDPRGWPRKERLIFGSKEDPRLDVEQAEQLRKALKIGWMEVDNPEDRDYLLGYVRREMPRVKPGALRELENIPQDQLQKRFSELISAIKLREAIGALQRGGVSDTDIIRGATAQLRSQGIEPDELEVLMGDWIAAAERTRASRPEKPGALALPAPAAAATPAIQPSGVTTPLTDADAEAAVDSFDAIQADPDRREKLGQGSLGDTGRYFNLPNGQTLGVIETASPRWRGKQHQFAAELVQKQHELADLGVTVPRRLVIKEGAKRRQDNPEGLYPYTVAETLRDVKSAKEKELPQSLQDALERAQAAGWRVDLDKGEYGYTQSGEARLVDVSEFWKGEPRATVPAVPQKQAEAVPPEPIVEARPAFTKRNPLGGADIPHYVQNTTVDLTPAERAEGDTADPESVQLLLRQDKGQTAYRFTRIRSQKDPQSSWMAVEREEDIEGTAARVDVLFRRLTGDEIERDQWVNTTAARLFKEGKESATQRALFPSPTVEIIPTEQPEVPPEVSPEPAATSAEAPAVGQRQVGDRVVIGGTGSWAGRHGEVIEDLSINMTPILGGGPGRRVELYRVKTDAGKVVPISPEELEVEAPEARPEQVVPDLDDAAEKITYAPEEFQTLLVHVANKIKAVADKRGRARTPESIRRWDFEEKAARVRKTRLEGIWQEWAGKYPEAAARVLEERVARVKQYAPPAAAVSTAAPLGTGSVENDERLQRYREMKRQRSPMTASQESALALYEGMAQADPSQWAVGDGVGWRVDRQVNRGFRVQSVDPETKTAVVIPVADTGLTTTGGDFDRIGAEVVHVFSLVRDRQYDAPRSVAQQETGTPTVPAGALPYGTVAVGEYPHAKRGKPIFIVNWSSKLTTPQYEALKLQAKGAGGWYSRQWKTSPAGFAFETREAAQRFAAAMQGAPAPTVAVASPEGVLEGKRRVVDRLALEQGLTQADYDAALPYIPDDVTLGSGEELGYVYGIKSYLRGDKEPPDPNLGGSVHAAIYKGFKALGTLRAQETTEVSFEGGRVIDEVGENRLKIKFDAKPDRARILKLRKNGFLWAPSAGVWQRRRGDNAWYAAEQALGMSLRKQTEATREQVEAEGSTQLPPIGAVAQAIPTGDVAPSAPVSPLGIVPVSQEVIDGLNRGDPESTKIVYVKAEELLPGVRLGDAPELVRTHFVEAAEGEQFAGATERLMDQYRQEGRVQGTKTKPAIEAVPIKPPPPRTYFEDLPAAEQEAQKKRYQQDLETLQGRNYPFSATDRGNEQVQVLGPSIRFGVYAEDAAAQGEKETWRDALQLWVVNADGERSIRLATQLKELASGQPLVQPSPPPRPAPSFAERLWVAPEEPSIPPSPAPVVPESVPTVDPLEVARTTLAEFKSLSEDSRAWFAQAIAREPAQADALLQTARQRNEDAFEEKRQQLMGEPVTIAPEQTPKLSPEPVASLPPVTPSGRTADDMLNDRDAVFRQKGVVEAAQDALTRDWTSVKDRASQELTKRLKAAGIRSAKQQNAKKNINLVADLKDDVEKLFAPELKVLNDRQATLAGESQRLADQLSQLSLEYNRSRQQSLRSIFQPGTLWVQRQTLRRQVEIIREDAEKGTYAIRDVEVDEQGKVTKGWNQQEVTPGALEENFMPLADVQVLQKQQEEVRSQLFTLSENPEGPLPADWDTELTGAFTRKFGESPEAHQERIRSTIATLRTQAKLQGEALREEQAGGARRQRVIAEMPLAGTTPEADFILRPPQDDLLSNVSKMKGKKETISVTGKGGEKTPAKAVVYGPFAWVSGEKDVIHVPSGFALNGNFRTAEEGKIAIYRLMNETGIAWDTWKPGDPVPEVAQEIKSNPVPLMGGGYERNRAIISGRVYEMAGGGGTPALRSVYDRLYELLPNIAKADPAFQKDPTMTVTSIETAKGVSMVELTWKGAGSLPGKPRSYQVKVPMRLEEMEQVPQVGDRVRISTLFLEKKGVPPSKLGLPDQAIGQMAPLEGEARTTTLSFAGTPNTGFESTTGTATGELERRLYPLAGPEMLEVAEAMMGGRSPTVQKIRGVLGKVRFQEGDPESIKIIIDPSAAKDPRTLAIALSHEMGHVADVLSDVKLDRGNILGRIASLHRYLKGYLAGWEGGPEPLTDVERQRLRRIAAKMLTADAEITIDEEIRREIVLSPDDILNIWRSTEANIRDKNPTLYDYIAGISTAEKKSIVKEALKGQVPEILQRFAGFVMERTGKQTKTIIRSTPATADIRRKYNELIEEELRKRQLLSNEVIRRELIDLSEWWTPYDKNSATPAYRQYRESSKELYAQGFSVLLNSPGELEQRAPMFYRGLLAYIGRKPELVDAYTDVQSLLNGDSAELQAMRQENTKKMFGEGRGAIEAAGQAKKASLADSREGLWQTLSQYVLWQFQPYEKRIQQVEKGGEQLADADNARFILDELGMRDNVNGEMMRRVQQEVYEPYLKAGGSADDLGIYLMHKRIVAGDRNKLVNPKNYTPLESMEQLDFLQQGMPIEQWNELERRVQKWHDIMWDSVERGVKAGIYSQKDYEELLLPNKNTYATFAVIEHLEDKIGARIYHQVGTFKGIASPFETTIMKNITLNRFIELNLAKQAAIDFMTQHFPDEVKEVPIPYGESEPKEKPDAGWDYLIHLEDGKPVAHMMPSPLIKAFEGHDIGGMARLGRFFSSQNYTWFHRFFITYNPGFMVANIFRDFGRTFKNLRALGSKDYQQLVRRLQESGYTLEQAKGAAHYKKVTIGQVMGAYWSAIPASKRRARGVSDELIEQMYREKALSIPFVEVMGDVQAERAGEESGREVDRLIERYGLREVEKNYNVSQQVLRKVPDMVMGGNLFSETLSKVAGFKLMLEKGIPEHERAYRTRTWAGTPNFNRQGLATPLTNGTMMYSRVRWNGQQADAKLAFDPDSAASWWAHYMVMSVLPKLAMRAATIGILGEGIRRAFELIPDYYLANYDIPFYWWVHDDEDDEDKVGFLTLPGDDTGRLIGNLVWRLTEVGGKALAQVTEADSLATSPRSPEDGLMDLFGEMKGELIPNLAPTLNIPWKWLQYAAGVNPYDDYYGEPIVPPKAWEAGGWDRVKPMLSYTANSFGVISQAVGTATDRATGKKTWLEARLAAIPGLSRLVRVSNRGLDEREWAELAAMDQESAQVYQDLPVKVRRLSAEHYRLQRLESNGRLAGDRQEQYKKLHSWVIQSYQPLTYAIRVANDRGDEDQVNQLRQRLASSSEKLEVPPQEDIANSIIEWNAQAERALQQQKEKRLSDEDRKRLAVREIAREAYYQKSNPDQAAKSSQYLHQLTTPEGGKRSFMAAAIRRMGEAKFWARIHDYQSDLLAQEINAYLDDWETVSEEGKRTILIDLRKRDPGLAMFRRRKKAKEQREGIDILP